MKRFIPMKMKSWDVCPECGARRIAVCRFCNTIGDDFPLADLDLILPPEHAENVAETYNSDEDQYDDGEEPPVAVKPFLADALGSAFAGEGIRVETETPEEEHQCKCHEHAEGEEKEHQCKCESQAPKKRHEMVTLSHPLDLDPEVPENAEEYPLTVMCPCCDEALYPQFLNVCRRCGHQFQDGVDPDSVPDAHFYVPEENEDDEDDDADSTDGSNAAVGCCLSFLCLTLGGFVLCFC